MINAVSQIISIIAPTLGGLYAIYKLLDKRFNALGDKISGLNDIMHTVRNRNEVMANILLSLCEVNDEIDTDKARQLLTQNGLNIENLVSPDEFIKNENDSGR